MQVPELARPQGFEVRPQFHGGVRRNGTNDAVMSDAVLWYMVRLQFFAPRATGNQACAGIAVGVNGNVEGPHMFDEHGAPFYIEKTRGEPLPLATQMYEGLRPTDEGYTHVYVLLTAGRKPPWRQMTRELFHNAKIFDIERQILQYGEETEQTPYQLRLADAPKRKETREQALRTAARTQTPTDVTVLRITLEDAEREAESGLKASDAEYRQQTQAGAQAMLAQRDSMRAELARMSVAARRMPAIVDPTGQSGPHAAGSYLADRDDPKKVWRVLMPDLDFWRARKSPVAVHRILVSMDSGAGCRGSTVQRAQLETFKKLDWAALIQLLDQPRP